MEDARIKEKYVARRIEAAEEEAAMGD